MTAAECTYDRDGSLFEGVATGLMHTRLELLVCGLPEDAARALWAAVTAEVARLEKIFNRFDQESDVSAWNAGRRTGLAPELSEAVTLCEDYKARTGGVFDVRHAGPLDFGGFAKGYALQAVARLIRQAGSSQAFVNFGNSTILGMGTHPFGDSWKVAVSDPWTHEPLAEFCLRDATLSVSGNSPGYVGHIVNPLSGAGDVSHRIAAVVSAAPLDAEVLSTAALAASPAQLEQIRAAFPDAGISIFSPSGNL